MGATVGVMRGKRTKSSPIGPAEQDDGGSLQTCQRQSRKCHPISSMKPMGSIEYIPSEVCKFLVDALKSHFGV